MLEIHHMLSLAYSIGNTVGGRRGWRGRCRYRLGPSIRGWEAGADETVGTGCWDHIMYIGLTDRKVVRDGGDVEPGGMADDEHLAGYAAHPVP